MVDCQGLESPTSGPARLEELGMLLSHAVVNDGGGGTPEGSDGLAGGVTRGQGGHRAGLEGEGVIWVNGKALEFKNDEELQPGNARIFLGAR